MRKRIIGVILIMTLIMTLTGYLMPGSVFAAGEKWLTGWKYRVSLTIDASKIDSNLTNFPVLLSLGKSSGMNARDLSAIFTELGTSSGKIAVTTSDGATQCYVEVEKWDPVARQAVLWVKVPSISSSSNTVLYFYFDKNQSDNLSYVGVSGSSAARKVWDSGYKAVLHMGDNPSTAAGAFKDSTANSHNASAGSSGAVPVRTAGKIGDSLSFNGDDYIQIPDSDDFSVSTTGQLTISFWLSPKVQNMSTSDYVHFLGKGSAGSYEWAFRIYNADYAARPQSISIYHWNPSGGLGAGSRWDHSNIPNGAWVYVTGRFGRVNGSSDIAIFGNGVMADTDSYASYSIKPTNGTAPLKIGTRSNDSYLNGRIDEFRVSSVARSNAWIKASFYSEGNQLVSCGIIESSAVQTVPVSTTGTTPTPTTTPTPSSSTTSATFGLQNGNITYNQAANALQAMRFLNTAGTGVLTKLELLVKDTTPQGKVRLGIYEDSNGKPGTLLLDAGEAAVVNGWVSIPNLSLPVTGNRYYWLAFNLQYVNTVSYQSGQPANSHYRVNGFSYGALASTFPSGSLANNNQYVMRATVAVTQ